MKTESAGVGTATVSSWLIGMLWTNVVDECYEIGRVALDQSIYMAMAKRVLNQTGSTKIQVGGGGEEQ